MLHSAVTFTLIKILGAIYLISIGVKLWRNGTIPVQLESPKKANITAISLYFQGLLVSLTNPKAIVFTIALFPHVVVIS